MSPAIALAAAGDSSTRDELATSPGLPIVLHAPSSSASILTGTMRRVIIVTLPAES
jgi:hypothetical protein